MRAFLREVFQEEGELEFEKDGSNLDQKGRMLFLQEVCAEGT